MIFSYDIPPIMCVKFAISLADGGEFPIRWRAVNSYDLMEVNFSVNETVIIIPPTPDLRCFKGRVDARACTARTRVR